jgi:two-component system, OmpR family, sensor histidine kinase KdpD
MTPPGAAAREPVAELRVQQLEQELLDASRELARVHRELEAARDALRRDCADREQLLDVVRHELSTPLTVIGGYHRLLLGPDVGPLNDAQRKFLEESHRSCRRIEAFLANMLDASRAHANGEVLELGRAALAPVIEGVAHMFEPMLAERGLTLRVAAAAGEVRCDPRRIEQVLVNLVGNAVKYARAGGAIEIATRTLGPRGGVEVSVSDDGPGIPAPDRERVFEPYVRLGDRRAASGIGLGLAICRRLVEAHGGRIHVEERPGGGCRFVFTLPEGM